MKTTIQILRWAGVLPAAIIAPSLACLLFTVVILIGDVLSGDLWMFFEAPLLFQLEHIPTTLICYGIYGYLMITVGIAVAPSHKKIVALSLFAINAILHGFFIIMSLIFLKFSECWIAVIGSVICIISAGIATYSFVSEADD